MSKRTRTNNTKKTNNTTTQKSGYWDERRIQSHIEEVGFDSEIADRYKRDPLSPSAACGAVRLW